MKSQLRGGDYFQGIITVDGIDQRDHSPRFDFHQMREIPTQEYAYLMGRGKRDVKRVISVFFREYPVFDIHPRQTPGFLCNRQHRETRNDVHHAVQQGLGRSVYFVRDQLRNIDVVLGNTVPKQLRQGLPFRRPGVKQGTDDGGIQINVSFQRPPSLCAPWRRL